MRGAIRFILIGLVGAPMGIMWFVEGFSETRDSTFQGGLWKGPILTLVSLAAGYIGVRAVIDPEPEDEDFEPTDSEEAVN